MIERLRRAPRAPLAVAGILAAPIFFVALMSFSLWLEKPTTHIGKNGSIVLGDPARSTIGLIYLLSFGVCVGLVVVGVLAMLLGRLAGVIASALAAIGVTILLLLPIPTWEAAHTARFPDGVDLIPKSASDDLLLKGEWEANARTTAHQIGFWTIAIAVAAIAVAVALDVRRRRGLAGPPVPPPPGDISYPS